MRRTRTLGIAIVMALALTALAGVASASAAIFEIPGAGSKSSTTWNGARASLKGHVLFLGGEHGEQFTCSNVAFSGEMTGQSTNALTVSPELGGCSWIGGSGWTWAMNGCKYRFNVGAGGKNPETGTVDIVGCESAMKFVTSGCQIEIGNQNGVGTVTYTKSEVEGLQTVNVAAKLTGITYTRSVATICPESAVGTFSNGSYTGEWTAKPAHFVTASAPANITGYLTSQGPKILNFPSNYQISCTEFEATGTMASVIAEGITLTPTFLAGCSTGISMKMGSCSFRYTASGDFQIVGANCASNPITVTRSTIGQECTISVGPQIPSSSGATLVNQGEGGSRTVKATGAAIQGIEYTAACPHCSNPGTFSDGEYKQKLEFKSRAKGGGLQALWFE